MFACSVFLFLAYTGAWDATDRRKNDNNTLNTRKMYFLDILNTRAGSYIVRVLQNVNLPHRSALTSLTNVLPISVFFCADPFTWQDTEQEIVFILFFWIGPLHAASREGRNKKCRLILMSVSRILGRDSLSRPPTECSCLVRAVLP